MGEKLKLGQRVATASREKLLAAIAGGADDWRRDHLGASLIGHRCDRFLWLTFRWAHAPGHGGRQLRLFERGHRGETWMIEDLRAAGFRVHDREFGEQITISLNGHFGGSLDGIITGLPESSEPHLLEIKTHNKKSFERLVEKGVTSSKPEHVAQMQVYMREKGLRRGLYVAICKDDDEIYMERVEADEEKGTQLVNRGVNITAHTPLPPPKLDPETPPCVLVSREGKRYPCTFFDLCHGTAQPERNCRTCAASTPTPDGQWRCDELGIILSPESQRQGCSLQLTVPTIINAQLETLDAKARTATYRFADGTAYTEG